MPNFYDVSRNKLTYIGKLGNIEISENLVKEKVMNREEILLAVQSEKQETGEYENTIARKAIMYGAAAGVMLCTVMSAVELCFFKKMDFGKPTMLFIICGLANLYEGMKCRVKKKIISGTIEIIVAALSLLLYIGALFV